MDTFKPSHITFDPAKTLAAIGTIQLMRGKLPFTPKVVGVLFLLTQAEFEMRWKLDA